MKHKHRFLTVIIILAGLFVNPLLSTVVEPTNLETSSTMGIKTPLDCPKPSMKLESEQEIISPSNDPKSIAEIERLSKVVGELQSNDQKMRNEMAQLIGRVSRLESSTPFEEEPFTASKNRNKRQVSNTESRVRPCSKEACAFDYSSQDNEMKPTIPTSCKDLLEMGHVLNGFQPVFIEGKIQLVFCNFDLPKDEGMETPVGFMDIKSSPVYFYFQKSNIRHSVYNVPMPFEIMKLNVGNAMDMTTGIFTAPKAGIYYFAYNGIKDWNSGHTFLYLQLNGNNVGVAHATDVPGGLSMSVHSTLKLQAGDKISLVLSEGVVHDFFKNYSNFVGWLLEEHDFVM